MKYQDTLEVHVPTTVLERQYDQVEDLNGRLFDLLQSMAAKYRETDQNAVSSGLVSTEGGYQTATDMNLFLVKDPAVATLRDEMVIPAAREYLQQVFGDAAEGFNPWPDGWANVLQQGDWQRPHFHPSAKNAVCGVYYVHLPKNMPEPQGNIEFFNPIPQSVSHGFPSTRRLVPMEGKLVLFPPWYVHYVHPFNGEGERAIIAFDILAQKPGPNFVF